MAGPAQEPAITLRDLLGNNWNAANTNNITPVIHTGDYRGDLDSPQVGVIDPDESTLGGGQTGFTAIDPTGSGGVKVVTGELMAIAYSHHDFEDIDVNPKILVYDFSEEIRRIVRANTLTVGNGLDWISWKRRTKRVDTNASPTLFRQDTRVGYKYEDRP